MKLPKMKYASRLVRQQQLKFGGLNLTAGAGDGELADMWNLTSDHYPVLATRPQRYRSSYLGKPVELYCWHELCTVEQDTFSGQWKLRYNHRDVGTVSEGSKEFGYLGPWLIVLPDKAGYNIETGVFRSLESVWQGQTLEFRDGTLYGTSAKGNCITSPDVEWSEWFAPGDAVTLSGCTEHPENNGSRIIREIDGNELRFYENSFTPGTETGNLKIARTMPDLRFLCESGNRLWGCTEDKIYASKLGDPFNWECYDGLDTDSYAVETGSAGAFTGCISFGGHPIFFKEDQIYKVYGSYPGNFQVVGSASIGVAEGCHRSLAVAGEVLFYQSRAGIMAYTGGVPRWISECFGTERFSAGVAGSDGRKYYISIANSEEVQGLYVFDTERSLWHKEDNMKAVAFARQGWDLYALDTEGSIWKCGSHQTPKALTYPEGDFPWRAEFADFTAGAPDKKGLGKLYIRLELEENAVCNIFVRYDSAEESVQVASLSGGGRKRSYCLPVVPRRCDHFRLILVGVGGCRIHSITREFYIGSALRSTAGRN